MKKTLQNLPSAETYSKEFLYMPWGKLTDEVLDIIIKKAPKNGRILDLMCGTGFLMAEIKKRRPDLQLTGVDLNPDFIRYAKKNYKNMDFILADALKWKTKTTYDLVICAAGIHHVPDSKQASLIRKIASYLKKSGFAITADPFIDDYKNTTERQIASAKLGYAYLSATVRNGATPDVIQAAINILENDVMGIEYKTSLKKLKPAFQKYFSKISIKKTWPKTKSEYGDYYFVLNK